MIRLFPELRNRIRILLFGLPVVSVVPANANLPAMREPLPAPKSGRPIAAALTRAVEALTKNPRITPGELAASLSVSPSYARTLLRRARARLAERPDAPQASPIHRVPPMHAAPGGTAPSLQDLSNRLTETEKSLAALRTVPVHARVSLNLNRRAEILRLTEAGHDASVIARQLGIPAGEVDFVVKINHMLASALQAR